MDDVAACLHSELDGVTAELRALLTILARRDFTQAESIRHARLVRRIAVVSSALHGDISSALTGDELTWLREQGVNVSKKIIAKATRRLSKSGDGFVSLYRTND